MSFVNPAFTYEFVRDHVAGNPPLLEPRPGPMGNKESLSLAWIVPPWDPGSGGHMTLFRLMKMMQERGHRNAVFVFDPEGKCDKSGARLERELREHFIELDAPVFNGLDAWQGADVGIATAWQTAYALHQLPGCYEKAYVVQDYEPAFTAYSSEYLWAEQTYRMGLRCVTFSSWLAELLRHNFDVDARWFPGGTDLDAYPFNAGSRDPATVAVYARPATARRGVELAFLALDELKRRRPEVRVVGFGNFYRVDVPFEIEALGVVPPARLAELFRAATVGVAFSLTNHSLVAQEMMASGLPVVEMDGDNVASTFGPPGEICVQCRPDVRAIADALEDLLDDAEGRAAMARRAREFVEGRPWSVAGDRFEAALREFLDLPQDDRPVAPFTRTGDAFFRDRAGR